MQGQCPIVALEMDNRLIHPANREDAAVDLAAVDPVPARNRNIDDIDRTAQGVFTAAAGEGNQFSISFQLAAAESILVEIEGQTVLQPA